ncbi:MAG: DUF5979 domain-containing protein [Acidimicrobiales bacterium]
MRRILLAIALLAPVALVGPSSSAQTQDTATLSITKVVDGDGPTGGYVIAYDCTSIKTSAEGGDSGTLSFDAAGPGSPETQDVAILRAGTCTVTETDANGAATTSYTCAFEPGAPPQGPADDDLGAEGVGVGSCVDDQSALITAAGDLATFTVTNTFEADVDTPDVDPNVVAATPPFTG